MIHNLARLPERTMQHSSPSRTFRRLAVLLLLTLIALAWAPRAALAQAIYRGDALPAGEVVDNDIVLSGDVVHLAGVVKGNAFVVGRQVTIDGQVEGSLFALGQRVVVNGEVGGSAYVVGLVTELGQGSAVGQNFAFLGISLSSARDSRIGRDLMALSLGAQLQGTVGRNTRLIAGLVQFLGLFMDVTLGPTPAPLQVARLAGRAPGLGQIMLPGGAFIDVVGYSTRPAQTEPEATTTGRAVFDWLRFRVRDYLPLLIVGLLGYWFLRRPLERSAAMVRERPLASLGLGLVGLILVWATLAAFVLVFVLILMAGIGLGRISLWNVSWLLWSLAYPASFLAFSLLLAFLNYGTKAIAMYALATYGVDRFAPRAGRYRWLLLLLGLLLYIVLRAIPTLGWVIGILVTAWGIGGVWLMWRERRGRGRQGGEPVAPAPAAAFE